jgi:hypothetical protein
MTVASLYPAFQILETLPENTTLWVLGMVALISISGIVYLIFRR